MSSVVSFPNVCGVSVVEPSPCFIPGRKHGAELFHQGLITTYLSPLLLASFVFLGGGRAVGHFSLRRGSSVVWGSFFVITHYFSYVYYTHSSSFCSLEAKTLKAKKLIIESFCVICCLWSHPFPEAVMLTKSLGKGLQG